MASPAPSGPGCPGRSAPPPAPNPRHAPRLGSASACPLGHRRRASSSTSGFARWEEGGVGPGAGRLPGAGQRLVATAPPSRAWARPCAASLERQGSASGTRGAILTHGPRWRPRMGKERIKKGREWWEPPEWAGGREGRGTEERGGGCKEQRTGRRNILSASRILADLLSPSPCWFPWQRLAFDGYSFQKVHGEKDLYIPRSRYPDMLAPDMPCIANSQTSPRFITLAAAPSPTPDHRNHCLIFWHWSFFVSILYPLYPHTPAPIRIPHQSLFQWTE